MAQPSQALKADVTVTPELLVAVWEKRRPEELASLPSEDGDEQLYLLTTILWFLKGSHAAMLKRIEHRVVSQYDDEWLETDVVKWLLDQYELSSKGQVAIDLWRSGRLRELYPDLPQLQQPGNFNVEHYMPEDRQPYVLFDAVGKHLGAAPYVLGKYPLRGAQVRPGVERMTVPTELLTGWTIQPAPQDVYRLVSFTAFGAVLDAWQSPSATKLARQLLYPVESEACHLTDTFYTGSIARNWGDGCSPEEHMTTLLMHLADDMYDEEQSEKRRRRGLGEEEGDKPDRCTVPHVGDVHRDLKFVLKGRTVKLHVLFGELKLAFICNPGGNFETLLEDDRIDSLLAEERGIEVVRDNPLRKDWTDAGFLATVRSRIEQRRNTIQAQQEADKADLHHREADDARPSVAPMRDWITSIYLCLQERQLPQSQCDQIRSGLRELRSILIGDDTWFVADEIFRVVPRARPNPCQDIKDCWPRLDMVRTCTQLKWFTNDFEMFSSFGILSEDTEMVSDRGVLQYLGDL
jgi:hypothetical protein